MKNQSINRNWYAGKLSATVAIAPIGNCNTDVIEYGMTNAEGVCVALDGSCSVVDGARGVGERDGTTGECVALTGSCSGENGVNVGERDNRGICRALTGECTGAGISEGERDRTGTCMVLTGSCTGAGISEGERDGTGTCVVLTGSCTAAGISEGERDGTGTCVVLTGSCTAAGISEGERDGTGTCVVLTGSCTAAGISEGERDGTGTCVVRTGSCTAAGISEGERDGTGTCVVRTGSCTAAGISEGERDGTGTCVVLTGSCTAAGISEGERDGTGTCVVRTGSCTAAGISEGERDGTGTCVVLTGSCTAAGISEGERDGTGTCVVRTGSCTAAGISEGERDGTGTCVALTGLCTAAGISEGERDGTGTCVALTGSCDAGGGANTGERGTNGVCVALTGICGTGVNAGLRDDVTGECILFSAVTGPTPDDNNPGIVGTLGDVVMNITLIAALLQTKMFDAATATPQAGGITQSSETGDRIEIADENSITYGEAGDITLAISNSGSGVTWSDISTEDAGIAKSYAAADIGDFKSAKLRKGILDASSVTIANLYVDVRTDISRPVVVETLRRMGAASLFIELEIGDKIVPKGRYEGSSTVLIEDTQTGRWSACNDYRPTTQCRDVVELVDSSGEKRLGVLFIGDNPAVGIEGEASYSGEFSADGMTVNITYAGETGAEATFLPAEREVFPDMDYLVGGNWLYIPETGGNWEIGAFADGSQKLTNDIPLRDANAIYHGKAIGLRLDGNELTNFEGDVRLTAKFVNAGGRGQIDGSITGSDLPAALTLNTATYDLTGDNRGIFTDGETSMEGGYTGTWGGQFYGNIVDPSSSGASSESSVSGTFGAVKGMPADSDFDVFLGSFGGTEQ